MIIMSQISGQSAARTVVQGRKTNLVVFTNMKGAKKQKYWKIKLQYITQESKTKINDEFGKKLGKLLIVTRGEKGSVAIQKNEVVECDSKKNLKIVDLTGAGDLFAAGFLHGFINNLTIKESLEKGTEMSSKIIQKIGARLQ